MTFPYAALGSQDTVHPAVPGLLVGPNGSEFPLRGLVDSGADSSCFPDAWAEPLGIDLAECVELPVHTGNGLACYYEAEEPLVLIVETVEIPVRATFGPIGVAIFGRNDFFDRFYVEIDERAKFTHLTLRGA